MTHTSIKPSHLMVFLCGLVVANIFIYQEIFAPAVLHIFVFTAGKSRATLLRTPGGAAVLVDTGPDAGILRALGTALPMWERDLNAVIITSKSAAAMGGLQSVLGKYRAKTVDDSPFGKRFAIDNARIEVLSTSKQPVVKISYGSTSLTVSSSTPAGTYISDGKTIVSPR